MYHDNGNAELIAWYGKLPSSGDYIQRYMPTSLVNWWANWFQNSIFSWQKHKNTFDYTFKSAPIWNFAIPATLGPQFVQLGCLLPAMDKVGRLYPTCAVRYFTLDTWHPHMMSMTAQWYKRLGHILYTAIHCHHSAEQLEQALLKIPSLRVPFPKESEILSVIGMYDPTIPRLSWQQVTECFKADQYTSFWWTNQADGHALITCGHSGTLTPQLFCRLFNLNSKKQQSVTNGPGLYPKMFD